MRDEAGLFDVDSVRRVESAGRDRLGDDELMERAGQAAWRALLDRWPGAHRILVVCGGGGNGGDGYVLARHALEAGRSVRVVALHAGEPAHAAAACAFRRFREAGGEPEPWSGELPPGDVLVDALLGIGIIGPPRADAAAIIDAINGQPAPVLALDVPSGLAAGQGGEAVVADATIEFLLPKALLRTGRALDHTGDLLLATLDATRPERMPAPVAALLRPHDLASYLPRRARDSHKGRHGRVLCIGGDEGSAGAILLCAEATLRSGAGLVRVHTQAGHLAALHARLPEAMASHGDIADIGWADVVALGPGLGCRPWARRLLEAAIASRSPLVLDADALNLVAETGATVPPGSILTPHPGEAARLLGRDVPSIQADRLDAACRLAARHGCAVVLKGAGTIVAAPGEVPMVLDAGNPGMATGGMGDVLTGVVAALLAQGLPAFDAACGGALLHACAGDAAAAEGGERGLLPSDLMPWLRRLGNPR